MSDRRPLAFRGRGIAIVEGLVLLIGLLSSACTPQDEGIHSTGKPSILRVGTTMSIKQTNPVADYYYNILAMLMTHDSLVRFDEGLNPVPQLALQYGSDAEGTTWTFDLAPNARWHDGHPVTPEDVAFTFSYIGKHHVSGGWINQLIDRVETIGHRVIFRLKRPYSRFLINAGFVVRILPRHIWETIPDPNQTQAPGMTLGCGPYRFDGFDRAGDLIRFRANPAYYGPAPGIEEVTYRTYGTMDLLALAMMKREVDLFYQYAAGLPAPYEEGLMKRPGMASMEAVSLGIPAVLGFNLDRPLTHHIAVRRSVALAIDYPQVNACLMSGRGMTPSPGLIPPSFPYHEKRAAWSRDVEKARTLLLSNGFTQSDKDGILQCPDGRPLTLSLLVRSDLWGEGQIVKLLAHDLEAVGIGLTVRSADLSTYLAFLKQGDYDMVLFRTTPWGMMMHAGGGSGYFDSRTAGSVNMCRLQDPAFARICDAILAALEPEALKTLYRELQRYYAEQLPAIALCWGRSFFPYAAGWRGFQINQLEGGLANRFTWTGLEPPPMGRAKTR